MAMYLNEREREIPHIVVAYITISNVVLGSVRNQMHGSIPTFEGLPPRRRGLPVL